MPDEHGNIRGIRVPRVPWHEQDGDERVEAALDGAAHAFRSYGIRKRPEPNFNDVELTHDPYGIGNPD